MVVRRGSIFSKIHPLRFEFTDLRKCDTGIAAIAVYRVELRSLRGETKSFTRRSLSFPRRFPSDAGAPVRYTFQKGNGEIRTLGGLFTLFAFQVRRLKPDSATFPLY